MVVCKQKKYNKEYPKFWSNGLNERGLYIFVERLCANERNKSMTTLIFGRVVVHIASAQIRHLTIQLLWATA